MVLPGNEKPPEPTFGEEIVRTNIIQLGISQLDEVLEIKQRCADLIDWTLQKSSFRVVAMTGLSTMYDGPMRIGEIKENQYLYDAIKHFEEGCALTVKYLTGKAHTPIVDPLEKLLGEDE